MEQGQGRLDMQDYLFWKICFVGIMKNISITERLLFGIRLLSFNLEHYEDQNMGPFTNSHIRKMMSVIFVLIYSGLLYKKTT